MLAPGWATRLSCTSFERSEPSELQTASGKYAYSSTSPAAGRSCPRKSRNRARTSRCPAPTGRKRSSAKPAGLRGGGRGQAETASPSRARRAPSNVLTNHSHPAWFKRRTAGDRGVANRGEYTRGLCPLLSFQRGGQGPCPTPALNTDAHRRPSDAPQAPWRGVFTSPASPAVSPRRPRGVLEPERCKRYGVGPLPPVRARHPRRGGSGSCAHRDGWPLVTERGELALEVEHKARCPECGCDRAEIRVEETRALRE